MSGRGGMVVEGYQPWEVQTFTGIGNQVVRLVPIESHVLVIFQTAPEAGRITVEGVNGKGQAIMFVVNALDVYNGTTAWDISDDPVVAFKIQCSVGWSLAVRPFSDARLWTGSEVEGTGPDVLVIDPPVTGFCTVNVRTGSDGHSEDQSELLFNFVGAGPEETVLPGGFWLVTIDTESAWSMAKK